MIRPSLLLDLRESAVLRGFHTAAVAMLMAPLLPGASCHSLTSANGDEELALNVLRHDTGLALPRWNGKDAVNFLLIVADRWPDDVVTRQMVAAAGTTLFACTSFALPSAPTETHAPKSIMTIPGHDTAAVAAWALRILGLGS